MSKYYGKYYGICADSLKKAIVQGIARYIYEKHPGRNDRQISIARLYDAEPFIKASIKGYLVTNSWNDKRPHIGTG
jgi:hypothetical protein